ncbi:MAG: HAMP domain-containing sensor histidine kinase [Bdellovibrionota bacterium]
MHKNLVKGIALLLNLGADEDSEIHAYVRLANLNGMVYFILDLFLAVLFYFVLEDSHISIGLVVASFAFLITSVGFNYFGWTTLSRLSTVCIGSIIVTYVALYLGPDSFIAATLLLGAIFPFVYFSTLEKKSIALCLLVPLVCYAFLIITNYKFGPSTEIQNSNVLFLLRSIFYIVPFFGIVANTYIAVSAHEQKAKRLQESQQLLETIFYGLSHDLANPLQNIYMISQVAESQGTLTSSKIQKLSNNTTKLVQIFNSLKGIARTSKNGKIALELKVTQIKDLIEEALKSVEDQAIAKNIILQYESKTDTNRQLCARVHQEVFVYQILTNFLTNSIKFSEPNQKIVISTHYDQNSNQIELIIRDWGLGMESTQMDKLFSWNQKTNRIGTNGETGSGIGLPLALKFLKSMDADLKITSQHHSKFDKNTRGTQVTIILPAHLLNSAPIAA